MQSALQTLKSDVGVKHNFFDNENVKRVRERQRSASIFAGGVSDAM